MIWRVRGFALSCCLFSCMVLPAATEAFPTSEALTTDGFRSTTVRLRLRRQEGDLIYTEHGSAFGVDLSSYGIAQARFLLTAAHCVLREDGQMATGDLLCEVAPARRPVAESPSKAEVVGQEDAARQTLTPGSERGILPVSVRERRSEAEDLSRYEGVWVKCRVLAMDRKSDLCLLGCEADIPVVTRLAPLERELDLGKEVVVVGCPCGVRPKASAGTLVRKNIPEHGSLWMAAAEFDHGNSGGPVFSKDSGQLIGVSVAGIPDRQGNFDHHVCLFVPQPAVLDFVRNNLRALQGAKEAGPGQGPGMKLEASSPAAPR